MSEVKISVIIPVYNGENSLTKCLNSILNNITDVDEVIVIDDKSTDKSSEVILGLSRKDSRIIPVFLEKNQGVSAARNIGLGLATGKYLCFVDSDDYWDENIKEVLESAKLSKYEVICFGLTYEYPNSGYNILVKPNICGSFQDKENILMALINYDSKRLLESPCNKMYRKAILDKYKIEFPVGISNLEDLYFNCNYFKHIQNIYISTQTCYHYVFMDNVSLSSKHKPNMLADYENIKMLRIDLFSNFGKTIASELHCQAKQRDYIILCLSNLYRKDCSLNRKDCIAQIERIKNIEDFNRILSSKDGARSLYTKIMSLIIRIRSNTLVYMSCKFIYFFRYIGKDVYTKYIRKLVCTFR